MPTKVFIHRFTVEGSGHFPTDMLRYDHCYPRDTESAVSITLTLRDTDHFYDKKRVVLLCSLAQKGWKPTAARWESFGWSCFGHHVQNSIND